MTIPESGTVDNVYTIRGDYAGHAGIISGADLVTTWTESAITESFANTNDNWDTNPRDNHRQVLSAADLSTSGNQIRITVESDDINDLNIDGSSICERSGSSDDCVSTPIRITWNIGGSTVVVAGGKNQETSDWIDFELDETKDYLLHFYNNNDDFNLGWENGTGKTYYSADGQAEHTMDAAWTSAGSWGRSMGTTTLDVRYYNVWSADLAAEVDPLVVMFDTTVGSEESDIASLDSTNEWYNDTGASPDKLYVYSTADPDNLNSPGMQAGQRSLMNLPS